LLCRILIHAGKRIGRSAALLLLLVPAACGFQPLYGPEGRDSAAVQGLQQVRLAPLPDRAGQQLHNFLRNEINPYGQPSDPQYVLRMSVLERLESLGIREDETATRANLTLMARFELVELSSGETLLKGRSSSTNSYDILDAEVRYATIVSEADARERAMRQIAKDIRTRLSVYFSTKQARAG
jgi:LPS-assembly lipoprotein